MAVRTGITTGTGTGVAVGLGVEAGLEMEVGVWQKVKHYDNSDTKAWTRKFRI